MQKSSLSASLLEEYTRVAYYYYKENCTQEQIAQRMHMSRQRVNRILAECLRLGIVQISICASTEVMRLDLESRLKQKYGLKDARVVDCLNSEDIFRDLGREAGKYLSGCLFPHCVVGVTRGRTLAQMAAQMPKLSTEDVTIVQLLGSKNSELHTPSEIIYRIAEKLNARPCLLFAPILVGSTQLKESFQADPAFQEAYEAIRRCDISIAGIGNAARAEELFRQGNVAIKPHLLLEPGQYVAGEIGSHIFDINGNPIRMNIQNHIIAVELEDYRKIPTRIGVAGSEEKLSAIRGAMLGQYINVLITDTRAAKLLCEE